MRRVAVTALTVLAVGFVSAQEVAAQIRPALVRSVDEPARVPYSHSLQPTCPFTNQCLATFPTVPAGKRLRITAISGIFYFANVGGFIGLHTDAGFYPKLAFPVSPFGGAYYGNLVSLHQPIDLFLEAGQTPVLEFGVLAGNTIFADSRNRLTVTGYLVDIIP